MYLLLYLQPFTTVSSPHSRKSIFAEVLALAVGGALVIILPFYVPVAKECAMMFLESN